MAEKNSLWKNIRKKAEQNRRTGAKPKKPTAEMLRQEAKIKAKKADGGPVNTLEGDLISKVIMNRNRDKDFVQRAYAVGEYPESNMFVQPDANEFGQKNSHLMSWGEDERGQSYMYPEVMNPNNEAIRVPNQYADYISSTGYKKATGMPYAKGGYMYANGGPIGEDDIKLLNRNGLLIAPSLPEFEVVAENPHKKPTAQNQGMTDEEYQAFENYYANKNKENLGKRYIAERDNSSTPFSPAMSTKEWNEGERGNYDKEWDAIKYAVDMGSLSGYYPLNIVGSMMDLVEGDYTGATMGLIPIVGRAGKHGRFWGQTYTRLRNSGVPERTARAIKKYGKTGSIIGSYGINAADVKSDLIDKKATGGYMYSNGGGPGDDEPVTLYNKAYYDPNQDRIISYAGSKDNKYYQLPGDEMIQSRLPEFEIVEDTGLYNPNVVGPAASKYIPSETGFIQNPNWRGGDALEYVPIESALLPASLPIKATSTLGKIGLGAAEMVNPISGFRNLFPTYKNVYRIEPTSWSKDPTDAFSGRWLGELEEMPFYIKNLKDPNAGIRIIRKKMPIKEWEKISGKNMPHEARLMSIGQGSYKSLDDAIESGELTKGEVRRIRANTPVKSDIEKLTKSPNLFNRNEGIITEELANKLRYGKKSKILPTWNRIEYPQGDLGKEGAMEHILLSKDIYEKPILGISRKYFPFKNGGYTNPYMYYSGGPMQSINNKYSKNNIMNYKRGGGIGGFFKDYGKIMLNAYASPFEALAGKDFYDPEYNTKFGEIADVVNETTTKVGLPIAGSMLLGPQGYQAVKKGSENLSNEFIDTPQQQQQMPPQYPNQNVNQELSFASHGGNINKFGNFTNSMKDRYNSYRKKSKGGTFHQYGINQIPDSAGLHHQNAYGGVPIGPDAMAEGGEYVLDGNYVVSDQVDGMNTQTDEFGNTMAENLKTRLNKYTLRDLDSKNKGEPRRPNDSISEKTIEQIKQQAMMETEMARAEAQAQEEQNMAMRDAAVQYAAAGGKLNKDITKIVEEEYAAAYGGYINPKKYKGLNMPYSGGGKLPKEVLRARVEAHMSPEQADAYVNQYAEGGGIHIKESKKGTFTAAATKHGKSVQEFARQVLANKDNYSSAMVKKANFARNAAKWKHAYGGPMVSNVPQPFTGPSAQNRGGMMIEYAMGGNMYATGGPETPPYGFVDVGDSYYNPTTDEIIQKDSFYGYKPKYNVNPRTTDEIINSGFVPKGLLDGSMFTEDFYYNPTTDVKDNEGPIIPDDTIPRETSTPTTQSYSNKSMILSGDPIENAKRRSKPIFTETPSPLLPVEETQQPNQPVYGEISEEYPFGYFGPPIPEKKSNQPSQPKEKGLTGLDYASGLLQAAGPFSQFLYGVQGPDDVNYQRVGAEFIDPTKAIILSNEEARRAQDLAGYNLRQYAPTSGSFMSNIRGLGLAAGKQRAGMAAGLQAQADAANVEIKNRINQFNNQIAMQEQIDRLQEKDAARTNVTEGLSGLGSSTANMIRDYRTNQVNQIIAKNIGTNNYKYDPVNQTITYADQNGKMITVPAQTVVGTNSANIATGQMQQSQQLPFDPNFKFKKTNKYLKP